MLSKDNKFASNSNNIATIATTNGTVTVTGAGTGTTINTTPEEAERLAVLHHDVKFVNSLLAQCGMECPFPFARLVMGGDHLESLQFGSADFYNLETATRILIALLNSKQRENAFRIEAEERQRRLNDELDNREILIAKYQAKLEASEKQVRQLTQQHQELTLRLKQVEDLAQRNTEEVNRLRSAFSLKEKHFNTELRKKEWEYDKLKDQIQSCLREPTTVLNNAARVENTVTLSLGSLSLSPPSASNAENYSDQEDLGVEENTTLMGQQLARLDLLEHENANLRQLLGSLAQILGEMRKTAQLNVGIMTDELTDGQSALSIPSDITPQITSLPVSWIYEKVKDEIETSLSVIGDFLRATLV